MASSAQVHVDIEFMLDSAVLDGVIVCTPTHLHFEHITACRSRGLPVLCEKPLADTRQRILDLTEEAGRGGSLLTIAYQRRYWPVYRTLRHELRARRWGEVRAVTSGSVENWQQTIAGTWRDDPQTNPGGFIGDAGSHKIDAVFFATGLQPVEVYAWCDRCGSNVEIVANVCATLNGGIPLAMHFIGHAQNLSDKLTIHCEKADLIVRDRQLWIGQTGDVRRAEKLERGSDPDAAFVDLLTGGGTNVAPAECALPVYDFTQAILQSSRLERSVRVADLQ